MATVNSGPVSREVIEIPEYMAEQISRQLSRQAEGGVLGAGNALNEASTHERNLKSVAGNRHPNLNIMTDNLPREPQRVSKFVQVKGLPPGHGYITPNDVGAYAAPRSGDERRFQHLHRTQVDQHLGNDSVHANPNPDSLFKGVTKPFDRSKNRFGHNNHDDESSEFIADRSRIKQMIAPMAKAISEAALEAILDTIHDLDEDLFEAVMEAINDGAEAIYMIEDDDLRDDVFVGG
jgi:hypothetical protein